jgi:Serine/threonine protein phosphatase
VKYSARTDKGSVRELNEDYCNVISGYPGIPDAFIIADGMGGHNSGEIASKAAVDCITNAILETPELFSENNDAADAIRKLMLTANDTVYKKSLEGSGNFGMGTTLILAVIIGKTMYIGHVGDSRLYHIKKDSMTQITTDHSYIEELIRNGSLTREEGAKHPKKNIITRAIGCFEEIEVDTYICELEADDYFVMCTDGLTNMLEDEEIKRTVVGNTTSKACEELVFKALKNGGEDNVTVIVIKNE